MTGVMKVRGGTGRRAGTISEIIFLSNPRTSSHWPAVSHDVIAAAYVYALSDNPSLRINFINLRDKYN